jgi:CRISPR/Cas system-associated endonuclease/helicase Cas3
LPEKLRNRLIEKETERVRFKYEDTKMNEETLCKWITRLPGPRLLIVNTVQSAAVIAVFIASQFGENFVEHISTALTPVDRKRTLTEVKKRLRDHEDNNWTLVATSCVEAGVDFSFRTGIREIASLVSLLQIAGRVRRNNEDLFENSTVWSIRLDYSGLLKKHPAFEDSSDVLLDFLINGRQISPSLCTEAFRKEMLKSSTFNESIKKAESICNFEEVSDKFRVIQSDTVTVLIDRNLIERVKKNEVVDWKEIQNTSVQIWSNKIKGIDLEEIRPNMYAWKYDYNDFIGYMSGILSIERFKRDGVAVL